MQHGNFEESFGIKRGSRTPEKLRRILLTKIYGIRSNLVREGIGQSYDMFSTEFPMEAVKRSLIADFVEMAILTFIESPRESCVGHPGLEKVLAERADEA